MNREKSTNRLFLLLILLSTAAPFLIGRFLPELDFYQSVAVSETIFWIPTLVYLILTNGEILQEMQLKFPKISVLIMVILFANLLLPVMTFLNAVSLLFEENYVATEMLGLNGLALGRNLMYIALIPALAEEFIFRGIFYHSYRPAGIWKAALCSGLCFGLVHMNFNQFLYAFVLGTVFALLVEATGSVIASVLAHFVINSNSVLLLALEEELEMMTGSMAAESALDSASAVITQQELLAMLPYYAVTAAVCGALALAVFRVIVKWSGRKEHMHQVLHFGEEKREAGRVITPALVIGSLAALAYMIVSEFFL